MVLHIWRRQDGKSTSDDLTDCVHVYNSKMVLSAELTHDTTAGREGRGDTEPREAVAAADDDDVHACRQHSLALDPWWTDHSCLAYMKVLSLSLVGECVYEYV